MPNPFVGIIREGALSTANVQRNLLLVNYPQYSSANRPGYFGSSRYNALQLRADKRFGAGGLISANYTFSNQYGNVETVTGWLESGAGAPAAGYQTNNLDNEWALSSFDVRHRAVINYVVDLPFGPGKKFGGGTSGFTGGLLGGWSVNGVTTFQAGLPLGFTATPNRSARATGCGRTSIPTATSSLTAAQGTDSASGSTPAASACRMRRSTPTIRRAIHARAGRSATRSAMTPICRGHGINNWNFAVTKMTAIGHGMNLQLRLEAFNLFNRVQFGQPNTTVTTAATSILGQVTTQANQPRLMQLAFKLQF